MTAPLAPLSAIRAPTFTEPGGFYAEQAKWEEGRKEEIAAAIRAQSSALVKLTNPFDPEINETDSNTSNFNELHSRGHGDMRVPVLAFEPI